MFGPSSVHTIVSTVDVRLAVRSRQTGKIGRKRRVTKSSCSKANTHGRELVLTEHTFGGAVTTWYLTPSFFLIVDGQQVGESGRVTWRCLRKTAVKNVPYQRVELSEIWKLIIVYCSLCVCCFFVLFLLISRKKKTKTHVITGRVARRRTWPHWPRT